jgi:hypothetical protein
METQVRSKLDLQKERRFVLAKTPNKQGEPYNPTESVPGECEVYDPTTDKIRTAVYLPGVSSIWADEIEALKNDKKIRGKKILFTNGWKIVSPKETNLLHYLLVAGYNADNNETRVNSSVIYKEFKTDELAKDRFETNKKKDNAVYFVNNADIREVRAYALALAANSAQWKTIQDASEFEVRIGLRPLAEKNPEKFIEAMQDTVLRNKVKVIRAIYADIIVLDEAARTLKWKSGDIFIIAPAGMDVILNFAELAVNNPKFVKVFEAMEEALEGTPKKQATNDSDDIPAVETVQETLLRIAMEKDVITGGKNNMWFTYNDEKYKTKKDILKALKEDKALAEEIFEKTK